MVLDFRKRVIRYILFFCFFQFAVNEIFGQAFFTVQDTICLNDSVQIENLSTDADSYYWNFCSENIAYDPGGVNLSNTNTLNEPAFIDFVQENQSYYAFITNQIEGTITRNLYESSLLANTLSENLGNFVGLIPPFAQGVQIVHEGTDWYVFLVAGKGTQSCLVRLDFGKSLSESPTATNMGNIGDLDYPGDLIIDNTSGSWVGFTVNKNTNTLTRFDFTNGIGNPPAGINLGNPAGLNSPCGLFLLQDNANWYLFVSNYDGNEITRLDFRGSLLSTPTGASIGDHNYLNHPFDLTILKDCEQMCGFVVNQSNELVRMEFANGPDSQPTFTDLSNIGNLSNPQGISDVFRIGDTLYTLVANCGSSTLTRLYFPGCINATPASSTAENPLPIKYTEAGIYKLNLVINEGQPNQSNFCRNVVVLDSADVHLGNDTLIADGITIELATDSVYSAYEWSTGSRNESITVSEAGIYSLTITNEYGCRSSDDIKVIIDIGIPNFFTPNADGQNDTWFIPFLTNMPESEIWVYDRFGNTLTYYKAGELEWDGTSNGRPLPMGTYWYVIQTPGIKTTYKGSVTIKR